MSALARWCARRRFAVLATWLVLLVGGGAAALSIGPAFTNATTLPASESGTAYALLGQIGSGESQVLGTGTIVWKTTGVDVDAPAVQAQVGQVLTRIRTLRGVTSVVSPYTSAGAAQIDAGHNVAYAKVNVEDSADETAIEDVARSLPTSTYEVEVGGRAFTSTPAAGGLTEVVGVLAALVVLLFMFRSLWAAVLPILTGVAGVGVSLFAVMLISNVVDLADSTPTMGALIGLAVGIDYALFIVNRHRKALMAGLSVRDSLTRAVDTSGRAVVFAGGTVVVALLGIVVVQIDILTGMARGAALTVAVTVAAALTLLPAMLAVLGVRVLSRTQRRRLAASVPEDSSAPLPTDDLPVTGLAARWARLVERRPRILVGGALLVVFALAAPALSLRLGAADASSDPQGGASNRYHSTMAASFGDGFDAPLLVVARTPDAASAAAFDRMATELRSIPDVTGVVVTPRRPGATVSVANVQPGTSAQSEATANLVDRIRKDAAPTAENGTAMQVYVGGTTASDIDNAHATLSKLPLYLLIIALLGYLLLTVAFRSLLVPLLGSVANLLTLVVALGVLVAVFQWGWLSQVLGVGGAAPVESLVPVLVIGVMFGLSMDYQVFLVSRMHEEWGHTRRNAHAVRVGLRETAGVITTAATIMLCVFGSFGLAGQRIIAEIGVGLAVAVLADAFVLRLTVMPALMHLVGDGNWAYPRLLDRVTPRVSIEGTSPATGTGTDETVPEPAGASAGRP